MSGRSTCPLQQNKNVRNNTADISKAGNMQTTVLVLRSPSKEGRGCGKYRGDDAHQVILKH